MIRINLLGVERARAKKAFVIDVGQQVTIASAAILVLAVLGTGWWFWSLRQQSQQLDADIANAQREQVRLRALLAQVQQFQDQQQQLEQRLALIRQLRSGQNVPVQLLDHISRSVPDQLWLTSLTQDGQAITIDGRSTTLIALSDFVGNLGNTDFLVKPIEIVNSQVTGGTGTGAAATPELIQFTVKAEIRQSEGVVAEAPAPAARGRGAPARGRGPARGRS